MSILFIGKRFYTNRDAYSEKFGRIYQLPYYWSKNTKTTLWLIDYHSQEKLEDFDDVLEIYSTPIFSISIIINLFKVIFFQRPKIIVASGDCYIGLLSYICAKLCRAKFVFDVYDKYDEFSGYKNLGFNNLFQFLLDSSHINLFASQALIASLNSKTSSYLVMNGLNTDHFKPIDKAIARKKFNFPLDTTLIGYFGSMEPDRGVEDLFSAVENLNREGHNITVILGGKLSPHLNLDQEYIHYLGNISFKDVPYALASCDILTIPYRRSTFMDAGASNKIAEAIACMRPIVATKSPNFLANFPKQAKELENYLAEPSNSKSLESAIKNQLRDKKIASPIEDIYWSNIALETLNHIVKGQHDE